MMYGIHKIVRIFAWALAGFLILMIGCGIVGGVALVGAVLSGGEIWQSGQTERWTRDFGDAEIEKLEIEAGASVVKIRVGDADGNSSRGKGARGNVVRVEMDSSFITAEVRGTTLEVKEATRGFWGRHWGRASEVVIYVRDEAKFDELKLNVGAGRLVIEGVETERLDLDLGAGKAEIADLVVGKMKVETGAGKVDLAATVRKSAKVNVGAGKADVKLQGQPENYRLTMNKGIGSIRLDGKEVADGEVYGSGDVLVDVDAGVGAVEITLEEGGALRQHKNMVIGV